MQDIAEGVILKHRDAPPINTKGIETMSLYDEDEMECPFCGHVGLLPNGSFEFECPICGHDSYLEEDDETMEEDD